MGAYCTRTIRVPVPAKYPVRIRFANWNTGALEFVTQMYLLKVENQKSGAI